MAGEPDDLAMRILPHIQTTLAEHTRRLEPIETVIHRMRESGVTALGWSTQANIRHDWVQKLRERVQRLEERV